jgi:hypothetical protein
MSAPVTFLPLRSACPPEDMRDRRLEALRGEAEVVDLLDFDDDRLDRGALPLALVARAPTGPAKAPAGDEDQ